MCAVWYSNWRKPTLQPVIDAKALEGDCTVLKGCSKLDTSTCSNIREWAHSNPPPELKSKVEGCYCDQVLLGVNKYGCSYK